MTDIVERLRSLAEEWFEMCGDIHEPLNEAAAEITHLRAKLAVRDWQPIETAPRTGARLWLFSPYFDLDRKMYIGWWHKDGCWMDFSDSELSAPTHWMPLPAIPKPENTP